MDWTGLSKSRQEDDSHDHDGDNDDDDEFDFYSDSNAHHPGAEQIPQNGLQSSNREPLRTPNSKQNTKSTQPNTITPVTSSDTTDGRSLEEKKAQALRKADILRAKVIAQRQNTPMKSGGSRLNSPSRATRSATPAPRTNMGPNAQMGTRKDTPVSRHTVNKGGNHDALGLDSLVAEGRAAAEASNAITAPSNLSTRTQTSKTANGTGKTTTMQASLAALQSNPDKTVSLQSAAPKTDHTVQAALSIPTNLSDEYYADLAVWLEMTGYHDAEYKTAKVRVYKERYQERKALEDEVERIQKRIAAIEEMENIEMQALRSQPLHATPITTTGYHPPLPTTLRSDTTVATALATIKDEPINSSTNKRARSPDAVTLGATKRRREDDIATDRMTSDHRQSNAGALDRRNSYTDQRRRSRSPNGAPLDRRQSHYRREYVSPGGPTRYYNNYDHDDDDYYNRGNRDTGYGNRG